MGRCNNIIMGRCNHTTKRSRISHKPRSALDKNGRRWHLGERLYAEDLVNVVGIRMSGEPNKTTEIGDVLKNEQKTTSIEGSDKEIVIQDPSSNQSDTSRNQERVVPTDKSGE